MPQYAFKINIALHQNRIGSRPKHITYNNKNIKLKSKKRK